MAQRKPDPPRPKRIQLPIAMEGEIGLGDVLKRITSSVGIKPCGGCQKRADWLNQKLQFHGKCQNCNDQNEKGH